MEMSKALEIVENAVADLGYPRVNPESLTALGDEMDRDEWLAERVGRAYRTVMSGFRALLAPVGSAA